MADRIRFYLDEHVSLRVALGLRRRGIDILRAQEVGLRGARDKEHLVFALQEKRVLVAMDGDFLEMHQKGIEHKLHGVLAR